jgi:hypothetical protein
LGEIGVSAGQARRILHILRFLSPTKYCRFIWINP